MQFIVLPAARQAAHVGSPQHAAYSDGHFICSQVQVPPHAYPGNPASVAPLLEVLELELDEELLELEDELELLELEDELELLELEDELELLELEDELELLELLELEDELEVLDAELALEDVLEVEDVELTLLEAAPPIPPPAEELDVDPTLAPPIPLELEELLVALALDVKVIPLDDTTDEELAALAPHMKAFGSQIPSVWRPHATASVAAVKEPRTRAKPRITPMVA